MRQGKKSLAYRITYGAFDLIAAKTEKEGYEVWKQAMANTMPTVVLTRKRMRGATYQVPREASPLRKRILAIRWLLHSARQRKEQSMQACLAAELLAAADNQGGAQKKRAELHKMAEANRAFVHL